MVSLLLSNTDEVGGSNFFCMLGLTIFALKGGLLGYFTNVIVL